MIQSQAEPWAGRNVTKVCFLSRFRVAKSGSFKGHQPIATLEGEIQSHLAVGRNHALVGASWWGLHLTLSGSHSSSLGLPTRQVNASTGITLWMGEIIPGFLNGGA